MQHDTENYQSQSRDKSGDRQLKSSITNQNLVSKSTTSFKLKYFENKACENIDVNEQDVIG